MLGQGRQVREHFLVLQRKCSIELRMVAGRRARATGLNAGAQIRRDHVGLAVSAISKSSPLAAPGFFSSPRIWRHPLLGLKRSWVGRFPWAASPVPFCESRQSETWADLYWLLK